MKNIHVLPTDKPSRLKQNNITKKISLVNKGIDLTAYTPINIYITSDEEVKAGDWCLENSTKLLKWKMTYSFPSEMNDICKKIILTTDQDLIEDGVQAINDEFLEWFVKNPSCEEVKIRKNPRVNAIVKGFGVKSFNNGYKIIIPKEELECEHPYRLREYYNENAFKCFECNKITVDNNNIKEPKQDSLEYGILQHIKLCLECNNESQAVRLLEKYGFEKQEEMYNEKEVELIANEMVNWAIDNVGNPNPQSGRKFDEVISKFKKK